MDNEFRFSSRKEYEEEIRKILSDGKETARKNKKVNVDEQYDLLVEEYVRFCEENG
jgi:hypothetical protein